MLSGFELLSIDLVVAARWINAVALALSVLVLGLLILRLTDQWPFAVLGALILLTSSEFLTIHTWAMSDPLYIALSLLAMLLTGHYLVGRGWGVLLAAAAVASAAYLARYTGLALVATLALTLAVIPGARRARRWREVGLVLAVGLIPIGLWFARNVRLTGQFAGRSLGWSGADASAAVTQTAAVILNWLMPVRVVDWLQARPSFLAAAALTGLLGVLLGVGLMIRARSHPQSSRRPFLMVLLGVYTVTFLGLMAFSVFFSRPGADLDGRTLSPLYPVLLALVIALLAWLWSSRVLWIRVVVVIVVVGFLGEKVLTSYREIQGPMRRPLGYASAAWQDSPTIATLVELSPDLVYTDDIAAVYLLANRHVYLVPLRQESATGESRSDYEMNMDRMRQRIEAGRALVALFHTESWPAELAPLDKLTSGLKPVAVLEDGIIYGPAEEDDRK
jgi:hypothetical protein